MTESARASNLFRFPPEFRLHHKPEFDLLYRDGKRYSDPYFLVLTRPNSRTCPRLGLSVSGKAVGNAVNRNRVKRVVRESFRRNRQRLPALDLVINARTPAKNAANSDLVKSLEQLWDKLARHA